MILIIHLQAQSTKRVSPLILSSDQIPSLRRAQPTHHHHLILTTAPITMHNAKLFLEDSAYVSLYIPLPFVSYPNTASNPPQEARACATAEVNLKPDDFIAIYRKRTRSTAAGRKQSRGSPISSCILSSAGLARTRVSGPYKWNEPRQLFHNRRYQFVACVRSVLICGVDG